MAVPAQQTGSERHCFGMLIGARAAYGRAHKVDAARRVGRQRIGRRGACHPRAGGTVDIGPIRGVKKRLRHRDGYGRADKVAIRRERLRRCAVRLQPCIHGRNGFSAGRDHCVDGVVGEMLAIRCAVRIADFESSRHQLLKPALLHCDGQADECRGRRASGLEPPALAGDASHVGLEAIGVPLDLAPRAGSWRPRRGQREPEEQHELRALRAFTVPRNVFTVRFP
eukprot:205526-Prymnesium_polylepis.1